MSDDLRETIAAAMAGDDAPAPSPAPEPTPEANDAPAPEAETGPARDEAGRFAPKSNEPTTEAPQEPETPGAEPIRPPASWSAQAKSDFATLPPHIQQEVIKRERDIEKGLGKRASELKRWEPLDQVIAPHRERWQSHGVDEATAIGQLIAADAYLRRDAASAIRDLAQAYGLDIRTLAQQPSGQPDPLQPLFGRIQTLEQQLAAQAETARQAEQAQVSKAIEAFKKDATYFEEVKDAMAVLIQNGMANGDTYEARLKDAYDRATWANPDIRALIQKDQSRAQQDLVAEREKAAKAKAAGGSLNGSSNGAAVDGPAPTLRDEIRRSMNQAAGRA